MMAKPLVKKFCSNRSNVCEANRLKNNMVNPSEIKRALLNDVKEPLVFHGYLLSKDATSEPNDSYWKCLHWDIQAWGKLFMTKPLPFRFGRKVSCDEVLSSPQWETTCLNGNMSYENFLKWSLEKQSVQTACGLEITSSTHWAYFDYYHMNELEESIDLKDLIDWSKFGFPGRGVRESTLWIGTGGANTPCHIDTYGCNLVAQVYGRKRWVLFPKSQARYLYPTRIPYEESSIYSQVGFPRPNLIIHPELCECTPYVVTLEPGDVLFVPNQWWHFVESLEFSISINTWLDLPTDDNERINEALVLYQLGSLCQGVQSVDYICSVLNPNMRHVAGMTSSDLLQMLASKIFNDTNSQDDKSDANDCFISVDSVDSNSVSVQETAKKLVESVAFDGKSDLANTEHNWNSHSWCIDHGIEKVPKLTFEIFFASILGTDLKTEHKKSSTPAQGSRELQHLKESSDKSIEESVSLQHLKILIDSFTDFRVIEVITKVINEKLPKL